MEYTIKKLASIAKVSSRTLRYYDEIGLLKPKRINSAGYRIYGDKEVDLLQQILFYRELGMNLEKIKKIINSPDFDIIKALHEHYKNLIDKRKQLELLINNVKKTIAMKEGRIMMTDKEKFEGFKKKMIEDNEKKYGKEIKEKYGDESIDLSNKKIMNMTKKDYEQAEKLNTLIMENLKEAIKTGDPTGELAYKTADLHRQWLSYFWHRYSKEAHAEVAQLYVEDHRFKAYYDKVAPGAAEFLKDAIINYTKIK